MNKEQLEFKSILDNIYMKYEEIFKLADKLEEHPLFKEKYGDSRKLHDIDHAINKSADAITHLEWLAEDLRIKQKKGEQNDD